MTCSDCFFYRHSGKNIPGYCQRYPPVIDFTSQHSIKWHNVHFPQVHWSEWCGEFKPKDEATE